MIGVELLLVLFYALVLFLSYWIPSRLGRKKLGKVLLFTLTALLVLALFSDTFDEVFFSKRKAASYLRDSRITLEDDFEIVHKEFSNSIDVSYRSFALRISPDGKQRIIQQIRTVPDYTDSIEQGYDIHSPDSRLYGTNGIAGYRTADNYVLFSYDYEAGSSSPCSKVKVDISGNTLLYEWVWGN